MAMLKNTLMLPNTQIIVRNPPYNVPGFSYYCWFCLFIFIQISS